MPLLTRRRTILAKIESVYGTDSTPTGAADAVLVRNLEITPLESEFASRDLIRPFIGNSEQLPVGIRAQMTLEVEMAGSGTAGTAPGYDSLMRACGLSRTLLATTHGGTAAGATTNTITLAAAASASNDTYNGQVVRIASGTGSGQARVITAYNGTTKVATVSPAWSTIPTGATYSIDAQASYVPRSTGFESATIYFSVDGVRHRMTGCRGNLSIQMTNKQIPVFSFTLTGIYNAVTDTADPAAVYTAFRTPLPVTNINTTPFRFHDVSPVMSQLSIDLQNNIVHRTLVGGSESVLLTDRAPNGQITIEADTVAFKDWWTVARNATLGDLNITHGTSNGNIVQLVSGTVQLTGPQYQDMDGIHMLQMNMNLVPGLVGNDELAIVIR